MCIESLQAIVVSNDNKSSIAVVAGFCHSYYAVPSGIDAVFVVEFDVHTGVESAATYAVVGANFCIISARKYKAVFIFRIQCQTVGAVGNDGGGAGIAVVPCIFI